MQQDVVGREVWLRKRLDLIGSDNMELKFIHLVYVMVLLALASTAQAAETIFDKNGKANIQCQCVLATTGCQSKVLWNVAGKEVHTWHQEISVKQNMRLDLNDVCYRKRDVAKQGEGLCCSTNSESETIEKLFRGTVSK